jgi:predicted metal-binding membrane protein
MTPAARERSLVRTPILLTSAAAWMFTVIRPCGMMTTCPLHRGSLAVMVGHERPGTIALAWALMLVAMMLPLMTAPVRHVRDRSFAHRRVRATVLFLVGYGALWMAAGVLLSALALVIRSAREHPLIPTALVVLVVMAWQVSPLKQGCLNRLHAHPRLAAFGVAADVDSLRFGLVHGGWCVGSCWGLMLLPMLCSSGHLAAMAGVSLWVWGEQISRPAPPSWSLRAPARAVRLTLAQARMRAAVSLPQRDTPYA